jgi:hypothetical protein
MNPPAKYTGQFSRLHMVRYQMTRGLIHSIFVTAQRRKLVRENPVGYVEKLREHKSDVDLLTLKEVRVLLSLAKGQSNTRSWWSDLCRTSPERAPSVEATGHQL